MITALKKAWVWLGGLRHRVRAEHQFLFALMLWPALVRLERGQDVLQWATLPQLGLVIYLVLLASRQPGWSRLSGPRGRLVWHLFWSFTLYITVATLVNCPQPLHAISAYVKHLQYVPLLLVGAVLTPSASTIRRWLVPYLVVLIVILALPLVAYALGYSLLPRSVLFIGPGIQHPGRSYIRYEFLLENPNVLAGFVGMVVPFCLFMLLARFRIKWVASTIIAALVLGGYVIYATQSRRVWIILPLVIAAGSIMRRGLKRRWWVLLLCVALAALLLYATREDITHRFEGVWTFYEPETGRLGPIQQRLLQVTGLAQCLSGPLQWMVGTGGGMLGFAARHYGAFDCGTIDGYYAVLVGEYGLVGLVLYAGLVLGAIVPQVRSIVSRRLAIDDEDTVVACLTASLTVLLAGFVSNGNSTFPQAMYLWAFLGMGLATAFVRQE